MTEHPKFYSVTEICEITGLNEPRLKIYIQREWIVPAAAEHFDREDLARARLIHELQQDFGINDEAVPLVLHLLDQLYFLRDRIKGSA